jgi:hypothetical protein
MATDVAVQPPQSSFIMVSYKARQNILASDMPHDERMRVADLTGRPSDFAPLRY